MVKDDQPQKGQLVVNDEHMADLACRISVGQRVVVDPGERTAEVMFVGKIAEIAPGYWIGVYYDEPVGKNDGSIKGRRCFECPHDFGGFLRPDHIRNDANPPPPREHNASQKQKEGVEREEAAATDMIPSTTRGRAGQKRNTEASKGDATAETRSARGGTGHTKTSVHPSPASTNEVSSADQPTSDAKSLSGAAVSITPEPSQAIPALSATTPRSLNAQGRRQRRQSPKREAASGSAMTTGCIANQPTSASGELAGSSQVASCSESQESNTTSPSTSRREAGANKLRVPPVRRPAMSKGTAPPKTIAASPRSAPQSILAASKPAAFPPRPMSARKEPAQTDRAATSTVAEALTQMSRKPKSARGPSRK